MTFNVVACNVNLCTQKPMAKLRYVMVLLNEVLVVPVFKENLLSSARAIDLPPI